MYVYHCVSHVVNIVKRYYAVWIDLPSLDANLLYATHKGRNNDLLRKTQQGNSTKKSLSFSKFLLIKVFMLQSKLYLDSKMPRGVYLKAYQNKIITMNNY